MKMQRSEASHETVFLQSVPSRYKRKWTWLLVISMVTVGDAGQHLLNNDTWPLSVVEARRDKRMD